MSSETDVTATEVGAGPELNAVIRRMVFDQSTPCQLCPREEDTSGWCHHRPDYSRDIRAAWAVVEEFARRRIPVSLYSMSHGVWFCFFGFPPLRDPNAPATYQFKSHEARANHPAEAICRAALAAMAAGEKR